MEKIPTEDSFWSMLIGFALMILFILVVFL